MSIAGLSVFKRGFVLQLVFFVFQSKHIKSVIYLLRKSVKETQLEQLVISPSQTQEYPPKTERAVDNFLFYFFSFVIYRVVYK